MVKVPNSLDHFISSLTRFYLNYLPSVSYLIHWGQISANNSTPLCYSKKTWYSAIIRAKSGIIIERVRTGLVIVLRLNTILGFQY